MANILKITRSNVATKGLILFYIDGATNQKSYKLHKPTELQDLGLVENSDGGVSVDITIGQINYPFSDTTLWINGVDQTGQTIDQIHDTLSALFLDSTGGGGGTTDVSTPPHIIYKNIAGEFDNSPTTFDVAGNELVTELLQPVSSERIRTTENGYSYNKEMRFGVTYKTILSLIKLNGIPNEDFQTKLGKALQAIRCIYDDVAGTKKIIIGNDNDIVPVGTPLLRTTFNENDLSIKNETRNAAQDQAFNISQTPTIYEIAALLQTSLIYETLLKIELLGNNDYKATFGSITQLKYAINILNLVGATEQIEISDVADALAPWMIFDIKNQKYRMNTGTLPRFNGEAAAILGGLTTGDLYRCENVVNSLGNPYFPICIVG